MVGGRRVKHTASNETTTTSMVTGGVTNGSDNNVVVSTVQPTTTQQVSFSLSLSLFVTLFILVFITSTRITSTGRSRDVSRPRENESGSLSRGMRDSSAKCRRAVSGLSRAFNGSEVRRNTVIVQREKEEVAARPVDVRAAHARRVQ